MSTVEHAVIAAAGFGSRLGRGHPKCLLEVAGRTLLDRQLEVLEGVSDVRIVVGYCEDDVIDLARSLRPDAIIVRNPDYATTTTLHSLHLATRGIPGPALVMDGDLVVDQVDVTRLLSRTPVGGPVVAYTAAKTVDAVYVEVSDGCVRSFSYDAPSPWEWANVAVLPRDYIARTGGSVFGRLSEDLPLDAVEIRSFEIDRPEDLELAEAHLAARAAAQPLVASGSRAPRPGASSSS